MKTYKIESKTIIKAKIEEKSFFQKLQDFMEKENFKLTDQTKDGKDIFTRNKEKVITEIFLND